jgi:hypothetical protein
LQAIASLTAGWANKCNQLAEYAVDLSGADGIVGGGVDSESAQLLTTLSLRCLETI